MQTETTAISESSNGWRSRRGINRCPFKSLLSCSSHSRASSSNLLFNPQITRVHGRNISSPKCHSKYSWDWDNYCSFLEVLFFPSKREKNCDLLSLVTRLQKWASKTNTFLRVENKIRERVSPTSIFNLTWNNPKSFISVGYPENHYSDNSVEGL